jgi:hypothetical protein
MTFARALASGEGSADARIASTAARATERRNEATHRGGARCVVREAAVRAAQARATNESQEPFGSTGPGKSWQLPQLFWPAV